MFAHELVISADHCACDPFAKDKLENPSQFNFGTFTGQCVDSCRFRRSDLMAFNSPALLKNKSNTIFLSNFQHEGSYWKAKFNLNQVQAADVGFEEFLPGIFHVFLVFYFPKDNPILLYPQNKNKHTQPLKIYDLVLSPEGVPPKNGKYTLYDAYMNRYLISIRVLSKSEVINWSVKTKKHKVNLYTLSLKQSEVADVLRYGLLTGQKDSLQTKYDLFSNNCATSTLDFIDAVIKPDSSDLPLYYSLFYPLERSLSVAGPIGTMKVFLSRKLINGEGRPLH